MKAAVAGIVVAASLSTSASASIPYDFFTSTSGFGMGASNSDNFETMMVGDSGTLHIYYSTHNSDINTGAFLDWTTSLSGVIAFTGASVLNADINIGPFPFDQRWQVTDGGTVTADAVDEMHGFSVTQGLGISFTNTNPGAFIDLGYDASASAFYFGSIDFDVIGLGTVDVDGAVGDGLVVHNGIALNPAFNTTTINVVPAPSVAGLLAVAGITASCRRR